jgi:hypothetical protein
MCGKMASGVRDLGGSGGTWELVGRIMFCVEYVEYVTDRKCKNTMLVGVKFP